MTAHPDTIQVIKTVIDTFTVTRVDTLIVHDPVVRVVVEKGPAKELAEWLKDILIPLLSALIGGGIAALVARAAARRALSNQLLADKVRHDLEHAKNRDDQLRRLHRRLELDANRAIMIGRGLRHRGEKVPMDPEQLRMLRLLWRAYFKDRNEFLNLASDKLIDDVDWFYDGLRGLATGALQFEARMAAGRKEHGANHVDLPVQRAAYLQEFQMQRGRAVGVLRGIGLEPPKVAGEESE